MIVNFRDSPNVNDVVPERCTEKLVDLVFVLATKLDINVNEMRAMLDANTQENIQKFDTVHARQQDNLETLNVKIQQLEDENNIQNEKLFELSQHHENTLLQHQQLLGNIALEFLINLNLVHIMLFFSSKKSFVQF